MTKGAVFGAMYKIGELSKICGLPVKTLRYYDHLQLLVPDKIDPFTGYRYYSPAKISVCDRIIALKELGFTLQEIKNQLNSLSEKETLRLLDKRCENLKRTIHVAESRLRKIESMKEAITRGDAKLFHFLTGKAEDMHVAYIRNVFNERADAETALSSLYNSLPPGIVGKRQLIINFETEFKEKELDLAVCVEITGKLPNYTGAKEKHIVFNSETASVICGKDTLDNAYGYAERQIHDMPAQIIGAFYEIWHDDGTIELRVPLCRLSAEQICGDDQPLTEFEDDRTMIGKWHLLDIVPCKEQFLFGHPKSFDGQRDIWLKDIYFMPGGVSSWIIDGWTKGSFTTRFNYPAHRFRHMLSTQQYRDKVLMFVEMKDNYDRITRGGKPVIYVYEKVSSRIFRPDEIGIKDDVNHPYAEDRTVLGIWETVGFVQRPEDFEPSAKRPFDHFVRALEFQPEGRAIYRFDRDNAPFYSLEWTKGMLLDRRQLTNSAYRLKNIDGRDYLFVQWKSGDYIFGGRTPNYYVFERQIDHPAQI